MRAKTDNSQQLLAGDVLKAAPDARRYALNWIYLPLADSTCPPFMWWAFLPRFS